MTIMRRAITSRGVKPIVPYQHKFKNFYLFGAFSAIDGNNFLLEMPYCNTDTFQVFLNEFSKERPEEFKIIVLDNGAFHKSMTLEIPDNIFLLFLPPYCPELNPAENMWGYIKDKMSRVSHTTLESLQEKLSSVLGKYINDEIVKSICGRNYYQNDYKCVFNV
jgi:transposase